MMDSRQRNIVKILSANLGKQLTAQVLSNQLKVSVRTIKSDIKSLNDQYPSLVKSSNKGYYVDEIELPKTLLKTEEQTMPQTPVERVRFIINYLLTSDNQYSYLDFSDLLYVSPSTIKNDLNLLQEIVSRYHLNLSNEDGLLNIEGTEHYKRRLLVDLLYDELEMHFFSLESIGDLFPSIDSNYIKEVIVDVLGEYGYLINDFGLYSSIIHICVRIDRMQKGHYDSVDEIPHLHAKHELEITEEILKHFEEHFSVRFNKNDHYEISVLIISKAYLFDSSNDTQKEIRNNIDSDSMDLARSIIKSINQNFLVSIDNEDFLVNFSMHIQNLKRRIQTNKVNYNPLTDSIKHSSPIIYEIGVFAANLIKESLNVIISDDEVAFIAIHIGSILKFQKTFNSKINTYLIIPTYYSYSQNLIKRITNLYHNDLSIDKIINSVDYVFENDKPDLIISVLPQPTNLVDIQWAEISLFFTPNDQKTIEKKIASLQHLFKQEEFSSHLEQLCSQDLFFVSQKKNDTMLEVLNTMCNQLIEFDYVEEDFLANVLKREELSSTAYFSFAIPHSINMDAKRTVIAIYINVNGIDWNGKSVQLVILPCFNSADRKNFNKIFEMFTDTLMNTSNIKPIVGVLNLEEFTTKLKLLL